MKDIFEIKSISDYNNWVGVETLHPLISIIDFSKTKPHDTEASPKLSLGFYFIALKEVKCGDIRYGRNYYDYQEGTILFIAPGQVYSLIKSAEPVEPRGKALIFHPDLIRNTALSHNIRNYSFFSYDSHEALHVSERERAIITDCFLKIESEMEHSIDKHSKTLIVSNIELLLNYCVRFYDRQFITRANVNRDIFTGFENLLSEYFLSEQPHIYGLLSVRYCAEKLHLSTNYFGDLIKKETGKSPLEHIQLKLISIAKDRIFDTSKSISEIAYNLGFKHPPHFTRLFKQIVGLTPMEYRSMNLIN
jgi:AraC-like DNA-binding protein